MNKEGATYHVPVLLREATDALRIRPDGIYVDATFGGGGHSREILSRLGEKGKLLAFDKDSEAEANVPDDPRFELIPADFRFLKNHLRFRGIRQIDGLLADLGISSHQIDADYRGFSYRFPGKLDMRMNRGQEKTAWHVVNEYPEEELARILKMFGELSAAGRIAREIIRQRSEKPIDTTEELIKIVERFAPPRRRNKFLSQVFQALRIEVNGELDALMELLKQSAEVIRPGGRLAVITYHSLEDRLVKHFIRSGNFEDRQVKDFYGNVLKPFRKAGPVIKPDAEEIARNPRARSAKLRVAEKIEQYE